MEPIPPKDPTVIVLDHVLRDRTLKKFSPASDSVWAHKPRDQALSERDLLLLDSVRVSGSPRVENGVLQSVRRAMRTGEKDRSAVEAKSLADQRADEMRRIMAETLREWPYEAVFRTSNVTPEDRTLLNGALERFTLHFTVLSSEIAERSPDAQEHALSKLSEVYEEIAMAVRRIAGRTLSREEIEARLARRGYEVCDETVVKLLVFEANRGATDPQFLALPAYHPYDPLICAVEYDGGTFPGLRQILSLFAFLDEYPKRPFFE